MIPVYWTLQLLLVPALSPLVVGIIRKMKAKLQNREGANVFQPYRDLWKLLHKDEVISADASWIFRGAPFVVFAVTMVVGASVPCFATVLANGFTSDMLAVVCTLAIGTFFLALAGMDTGSGFGGFGSSREMTVSALAEGGFIFSLLTVAVIGDKANVITMAGGNQILNGQSILALVLAFLGFFIVLLAETSRYPFDNPATHLELTMIHEAMILEYSGKRLALMEWAASNKLLIFMVLGANLFFPLGLAKVVQWDALVIGLAALMVKIIVFSGAIALIESTTAKFRFFRLPDLLIISFILNCVAIGLVQ